MEMQVVKFYLLNQIDFDYVLQKWNLKLFLEFFNIFIQLILNILMKLQNS